MERIFEHDHRMCVMCNSKYRSKYHRIRIKRKNREREEIQLNLKKILQGEIRAKVLSPSVKMKFISRQIVLYQTL